VGPVFEKAEGSIQTGKGDVKRYCESILSPSRREREEEQRVLIICSVGACLRRWLTPWRFWCRDTLVSQYLGGLSEYNERARGKTCASRKGSKTQRTAEDRKNYRKRDLSVTGRPSQMEGRLINNNLFYSSFSKPTLSLNASISSSIGSTNLWIRSQ